MLGLKKYIKALIIVCFLINAAIFLAACNLPANKSEKNIEEEITDVQDSKGVSVNLIGSISGNVTIGQENSETHDTVTREYSDFFSLCDADLEYIADAAYEDLKEVLGQVEWYPDFEPGKEENLDFYLQKYKELLLLEREYVNPSDGERATLDSLIARQINEPDGSHFYYDMEINHYYIYDFDGDGAQELCVEVVAPVSIYIFKYDVQNDEVYLWYETGSFSQLGGTRTVFSGDGRPEYMDILNENGEEESTYMNYCGFQYIIAVPCKNDEGEIIVSDELYENSYQIADGDGRGYFCVTEEQFKELGQYMWDARAWAEKEIEKYQYSYDELFRK